MSQFSGYYEKQGPNQYRSEFKIPVFPDFYKDKEKEIIGEDLFDKDAQEWAKVIQKVSRTQMRRFFNEVKRISKMAETYNWEKVLPHVKLMKSKMVYTISRAKDNKTEDYYNALKIFIEKGIAKINSKKDYETFVLFLEAIYGFYYPGAPK